jgi:hypothetical protein
MWSWLLLKVELVATQGGAGYYSRWSWLLLKVELVAKQSEQLLNNAVLVTKQGGADY